jgi:hypothetical protein
MGDLLDFPLHKMKFMSLCSPDYNCRNMGSRRKHKSVKSSGKVARNKKSVHKDSKPKRRSGGKKCTRNCKGKKNSSTSVFKGVKKTYNALKDDDDYNNNRRRVNTNVTAPRPNHNPNPNATQAPPKANNNPNATQAPPKPNSNTNATQAPPKTNNNTNATAPPPNPFDDDETETDQYDDVADYKLPTGYVQDPKNGMIMEVNENDSDMDIDDNGPVTDQNQTQVNNDDEKAIMEEDDGYYDQKMPDTVFQAEQKDTRSLKQIFDNHVKKVSDEFGYSQDEAAGKWGELEPDESVIVPLLKFKDLSRTSGLALMGNDDKHLGKMLEKLPDLRKNAEGWYRVSYENSVRNLVYHDKYEGVFANMQGMANGMRKPGFRKKYAQEVLNLRVRDYD